jgi:transcriptional regulator with XRE-family HTH domain
MSSMGEKIKSLRSKSGKTLKETGEVFGVKLNTVYRWEHDITAPRAAMLKRISEHYEVPLDWFFQRRAADVQEDTGIEGHLLTMYRQLPDTDKYEILGHVARTLESRQEK